MLEAIRSACRRLFSDRHVSVVSLRPQACARHLVVRWPVQLVALALAVAAGAGVAQLVAGYAAYDRMIQDKEAEVAFKDAEALQAEVSVAGLREMAMRLQERLEQASARLAAAQSQNSALRGQLYTAEVKAKASEETARTAQTRLAAIEEALDAKSSQATQLGRALDATRGELRQSDSQRATAAARLRQVEGELQAMAGQETHLKIDAQTSERKLQHALIERDHAAAERDKLLGERDRLKTQLAALEHRPARQGAAPVAVAAAGATAERGEPARSGWSDIERLLTSVGIDIAELTSRLGGVPPAQGGPYLAFDALKARKSELPPETLQKIMKSLPFAAPLDEDYQLESRFGVRVDPFNRRKSMHAGLDFSAPFRTPVFNTAPGTVIFAGPKGDYGKVVEVEHGSGVVTRYAHLHRITVAPGQRLGGREQIGLLGSTGRSSGPHVHYEILVNGAAQNPELFLNAARKVVPVAAK